jgi:predicted enzyme related to lactoylglutathione lyase
MSERITQSQITFLYYHDLEPAITFYEDVLGFELVDDQEWARIYRACGQAFIGIVAGAKGFHKPQATNAVLVTLAVDDVPGWYEHLVSQGVTMLTGLQEKEEIQVRCFFFQDPGGYTFEVQQFLKPQLADVFHNTS